MQIIGYKWRQFNGIGWQPYLIINNGGVKRIPLWGANIDFQLGQRFCVGHWVDGKYVPCENKIDTKTDKMCDRCMVSDDWFGCIKCSGEVGCSNLKKREECQRNLYCIYLAAFGEHVKIGISYQRRFFERLIEQGADFCAKLATVKDGAKARALEQKVSRSIHLTDRIYGRQKYNLLLSDPNKSVISISKTIAKIVDSGMEISPHTEIYDLRENYRLDAILSYPKWIELACGLKLKGKIISAKGNVIVIQDGVHLNSFNAHELVGFKFDNIKGLAGSGEVI